jgi:hypothetical protein
MCTAADKGVHRLPRATQQSPHLLKQRSAAARKGWATRHETGWAHPAWIRDSPGRGPHGYPRNFQAMGVEKLEAVIAELEEYGRDSEALAAALATAGRPAPKRRKRNMELSTTVDGTPRTNRTFAERSESARKGWETRRANGRHPIRRIDMVVVEDVEVETQYTLWAERRSRDELGWLTRAEHELVLQFQKHLQAAGDDVKSKRIQLPAGTAIRTDLFNVSRHQLVEAKDNVSRQKIRMALGQLLDYRRFIDPPPDSAVLVPSKPGDELIELLARYGISVIWRAGAGFADTRSGAFV